LRVCPVTEVPNIWLKFLYYNVINLLTSFKKWESND